MSHRVARMLPVLVVLLAVASCRGLPRSWFGQPPESPDITPTELDYVDADGFDGLLETALVSQDPVIIIRTGHAKPEWTGRLNAWIAAWNQGSAQRRRRAADDPPLVVRAQSPLGKLPLDGDSIREFRLLVDGLFDRVEDAAQTGKTWWAEERARTRRVALLKPYSLRFHKDDEERIQLVFFHGQYAAYYARHLQLLMRAGPLPDAEWTRGVECSDCKRQARERLHHLTSTEGD